jgi:hypothetical protein
MMTTRSLGLSRRATTEGQNTDMAAAGRVKAIEKLTEHIFSESEKPAGTFRLVMQVIRFDAFMGSRSIDHLTDLPSSWIV